MKSLLISSIVFSHESCCFTSTISCILLCVPLYRIAFTASQFAVFFAIQAGALDKLEAFTSFNGPDFYGLPRNTLKITLKKEPWKVLERIPFPSGEIIPMFAGQMLDWKPSF